MNMAIEAFPRLFVAVAGHLHQAALLARVHVITLYMANTDAVLRTSLAAYRSGLPPLPGPTPPDAEGTAPRGGPFAVRLMGRNQPYYFTGVADVFA